MSWDLIAGETPDEAGVYFGAVRANKSEDPRIPVAHCKMDGYSGSTARFKRRIPQHRHGIRGATLGVLPTKKSSAFYRAAGRRKHGVIFVMVAKTGETARKRYPSYFVFRKILTESGVIIYSNMFRIDGYGVKVDAIPFAMELRKSTSLPVPGWEGANHAIPFAQGMSLKSWTKAQETTLCDQWKNASDEEVGIFDARLAKMLGKNACATKGKRIKLGLLRSEHRPTGWTSELEQIIRDNYETKTEEEIAVLPAMVAAGKTVFSVKNRGLAWVC